jgi:hypothetical protein
MKKTIVHCEDCAFWVNPLFHVLRGSSGECHRFPPDKHSRWPKTYGRDGCGEGCAAEMKDRDRYGYLAPESAGL